MRWRSWRSRKLVMAIAIVALFSLWAVHLSSHRMSAAFESSENVSVSHVSFRLQVPTSPSVVVHLDLKGSPPTLPFLKKFLRLIRREGADGLLIEYEDMFPFEGRLTNISARNAYSKSEVRQILNWAEEFGLHVIPLVQTFGHLEYVLKLEEFRHLRELRSFPQELCPSNPESMTLVTEMVEQVMALHTPSTRFLHVGCDEVYHLNACGRCTARNLQHSQLFEEHVLKVVRMVRSKFPNVTPLMWDDMLRHFTIEKLTHSPLSELVEPVVWVYGAEISKTVPNHLWFSMGRAFPRLWGAAAYRGASGAFAPAPDVKQRLQNVVAWRRRQMLQGAGEAAPSPAGLVLSGWARYDHFASLTELLPAAVPSLTLALQAARSTKPLWNNNDTKTWRDVGWWSGGGGGNDKAEDWMTRLMERWRHSLKCPLSKDWLSLDDDPTQWDLAKCKFLGQNVFAAIRQCHLAQKALQFLEEDYEDDELKGWLTEYHMARRFSSPYRVLSLLQQVSVVRSHFSDCRRVLTHALDTCVDPHTTREWMAQRVQPGEKRLLALETAASELAQVDVWPRRPLD